MWDIISDGERNHVIPKDDLKPHSCATDCWCWPTDDNGVMVHHSMDRREYFEREERIPT